MEASLPTLHKSGYRHWFTTQLRIRPGWIKVLDSPISHARSLLNAYYAWKHHRMHTTSRCDSASCGNPSRYCRLMLSERCGFPSLNSSVTNNRLSDRDVRRWPKEGDGVPAQGRAQGP